MGYVISVEFLIRLQSDLLSMDSPVRFFFWFQYSCLWLVAWTVSMLSLAAQTSVDVERLKVELSKATTASDSVSLLIALADEQSFSSKTEAEENLQIAQGLAQNNQLDSLLAEVYLEWQQFYLFQDDYEQSLNSLDSTEQIFTRLACARCLALVNDERGHVLSLAGRRNDAYAVLLEAYKQYQELEDDKAANRTRILIASLLDQLKVYDQAAGYYEDVFDFLATVEDTMANYSQFYLGSINYGIHLTEQQRYTEAQEYFRLVRRLAKAKEDDYVHFATGIDMGWVYAELGVLDSARIYCEEALEQSIAFDDIYGESFSCVCLGRVALEEKKYKPAEEYLLHSDSLMTSIGILAGQEEVKELLIRLYKEQKNYQAAFVQQEIYQTLNDSTYNIDKAGQLALLQTQHGILESQREYDVLQKDLQQQTKLKQIYILLGILSGLILLLVLRLLWAQRNNSARLEKLVEKRTTKLEEANNELKEFAYITSHDMREPIRSINSFTTLIERRIRAQDYQDIPGFLQIIHNNSIQLNALITDVYNFMRIEDEKTSVEAFLGSELVTGTQRDLAMMIEQKNAELKMVKDTEIVSNRSLLRIILRNLVENSLKYNKSEAPLVEVNFEELNAYYHLKVSDNGIGIAPEYHEQVFQMFKRLHDRETYSGSGLGLAICRKIAYKLGGDISIIGEGLENRGVAIELRIPILVTTSD